MSEKKAADAEQQPSKHATIELERQSCWKGKKGWTQTGGGEVLGGRFPFFSRQLCHLQELRAQRATDEPSASEGNGQRDKVSLRTCEAALLCHLNQDYIQSSFTGYSNAQWIQLRFRAKIFTKDAAASISLTSRQIKEKKELRFFWILN